MPSIVILVMINEIGKEFRQKWKYVDDLSTLKYFIGMLKVTPLKS